MSDLEDPGLISLTARRRRLTLEAEVAELREQNERLAKLVEEGGHRLYDARITKHSEQPCKYHLAVVVDMDSPVVECATCKTRLDAIEVLREFARKERAFMSRNEAAIQAQKQLEAQCSRSSG